jgi:hypothetical protein
MKRRTQSSSSSFSSFVLDGHRFDYEDEDEL